MAIIITRYLVGSSDPEITRTFKVKNTATFLDLHYALQRFYNFDNDHLYEFLLGKKLTEEVDGDSEEVYDLLEDVLKVGEKFLYVYDFGDNWEISLKITEINEKRMRNSNALIEAQGAGPIEDIGGIYGFNRFKEKVKYAKTIKDPDELQKFLDENYIEEEDLDFDPNKVIY